MNPYDASRRGYHIIDCCLTEVPRDIPAEALTVNLHFNPITSIHPGVFSHLTQCIRMTILGTQITRIQRATFTGMKSLTLLDLQGSRISVIEESAFQGLQALKSLFLFGNSLFTLGPGMFHGLRDLEDLSVSQNNISNIQGGTFDSLYYLSTVSLYGNRLRTLDPNLLVNLPRPLELAFGTRFERSEWNCSSLCWLQHEKRHRSVTFAVDIDPVCTADDVQWQTLECRHEGKCCRTKRPEVTVICTDQLEEVLHPSAWWSPCVMFSGDFRLVAKSEQAKSMHVMKSVYTYFMVKMKINLRSMGLLVFNLGWG